MNRQELDALIKKAKMGGILTTFEQYHLATELEIYRAALARPQPKPEAKNGKPQDAQTSRPVGPANRPRGNRDSPSGYPQA